MLLDSSHLDHTMSLLRALTGESLEAFCRGLPNRFAYQSRDISEYGALFDWTSPAPSKF